MLEYFTYKKVKKHQEQKAEKVKSEGGRDETTKSRRSSRVLSPAASPSPGPSRERDHAPVLDREDQRFFERLTSTRPPTPDDDEDAPPLPPRIRTPEIDVTIDSDSDMEARQRKSDKSKDKGKQRVVEKLPTEDVAEKPKRFSFVSNISRNMSLRKKPTTAQSGLKASSTAPVSGREAEREEIDVARVLDDLDLSAEGNKVFSLSAESNETLRRFTQVFKDLVNGVPTAYGDLVGLIEDRDGAIAKSYEKLPNSLKKLVAQLPEQLTSKMAPELLAVAAEAQGLSAEQSAAAAAGGLSGAAKSFLSPKNLQDLVTKPGALVGMLKAIVNALKVRWPAFMGANILWSVALFLLLSMLWYCYKRGRETRLEKEAIEAAGTPLDGSSRIEELPDDPQLPPTRSGDSLVRRGTDSRRSSRQGSDRSSHTGRRSHYDRDDDHHRRRRRSEADHNGHRSRYSSGASRDDDSSADSDRRRRERRRRQADEDKDKESSRRHRSDGERRKRSSRHSPSKASASRK